MSLSVLEVSIRYLQSFLNCYLGGSQIMEEDLDTRYHTHCDPRLNAEQALEIAFYVASRYIL